MPVVFLVCSANHKVKIRIENPTMGGARFTSLTAAQSYVFDGRAKFSACGTRLIFLPDRHAAQSASLTAKEQADQTWRLAEHAYDGIGMMTLAQVAGIPVVCDPIRLFQRRTRISRST